MKVARQLAQAYQSPPAGVVGSSSRSVAEPQMSQCIPHDRKGGGILVSGLVRLVPREDLAGLVRVLRKSRIQCQRSPALLRRCWSLGQEIGLYEDGLHGEWASVWRVAPRVT